MARQEINGRPIIWRPQPRQAAFMRRSEDEALYGGAAGGGKSDALVIEALRQVDVPNYRALILRKTFPQLRELIDKTMQYYKPVFPKARYNASNHCWTFPSGAKIYFGSMFRAQDKYNYQGQQFDFIGVDELTHFTWEEYSYLMSRNRPSGPGTQVYIRATANPGGIGHGWVKARFITPAPPGTRMVQLVDVKKPDGTVEKLRRTRVFIPSTIFDNPALLKNDPGYLNNLASLPEAEKQALLYCNGVVLYASENDPALAERGFYDHGKYPFVFDPLFMEEDSPAGFGYIDVMKDTQTAIDEMNHAMDENVKLAAKQRFVLSDTAGVNEKELADFSKDIVHVVGRLNSDSFMPLQTNVLSGNCMNYRDARVNELKEVSGNRDVSQGGTTSGLTAASAIAALQEAGSKLSRDMLKSAYRAFAKECYLIIELMRQFYDEQRVYRITGESGGVEYATFSAQQLRGVPGGVVGGVQLGDHEPVFDITVSAAKKSTFSRLSQNETAKECYQLGFFAPANADAALAALDMMDFEGIEKVRERVSQNGTLYQQLQQMAAQLQKMAAIIDSQNGTNVSAAASAAGQAAGAAGGGSGGSTGAKTSTNSLGGAVGGSDNSLSTQAARRAMDVNNPNK